MKKRLFGFTIGQLVLTILSLLIFTTCLSYCAFFSPMAKYNPTQEELIELAKDYDLENGTDYAQILIDEYTK